ncbi:MAG: peptide chain release factor N(5)-glutamine methyltransferase [Synergistaceae bacterium]|jgi:release factor glutamine methyltransferase|nr:peptide chain release factor N(5)-glutamine methyltransferase [Synergistaceae bacterium]
MDVGQARADIRRILARAGMLDAAFEVDQIFCSETGMSRAALHAHPEIIMDAEVFSRITGLAARRALGEPLAYVLESARFCGREFSPRETLIPRPETEVLTNLACDLLKRIGTSGGYFADWCTGSGCIAITLLLENPGWRCLAVDSSSDALRTARANAASHGVLDRMTTLLCDTPEKSGVDPESLDIVIANPPYIPTQDIETLENQVRDFEPLNALDGGMDGLDTYRTLLRWLPRLLKPGGCFFAETGGEEQANDVISLGRVIWGARSEIGGINFVEKLSDHRGISRFILWQKPPVN